MLTGEHAIVNFDRGRAVPDKLVQSTHAHYVGHARAMIQIYRRGIGRQRRELHRETKALFYDEPDCPSRRVAAFCKLLDDASTYQAAPQAWHLRMAVFREAARRHPLVEQADRLFDTSADQFKQALAEAMHRPWREIEGELYADVLSCQRLETFHGYEDPRELLRRYNVAQIQAALYTAARMTVWIRDDFKFLLRYIKLSKLLHHIRRQSHSEYAIELTGPASELLPTRRYGVNLARFLPALLACRDWRMRAELRNPWNQAAWLELSDRDGFKGDMPSPQEFDSSVEEAFARKFGSQRGGWTLVREGTILHHGQKTFVPDFQFRHDDGTEVLMEIVGFWTPEYLEKKRTTLREFSEHRILLAVQERFIKPKAMAASDNLIPYKTRIALTPVLEALEAARGVLL